MKSFGRLLIFVACVLIMILFFNYAQARRVVSSGEVPSETEFQQLQYCLFDSDCQIVRWHDCSDCQYARALNQRWAKYFYDNADYYQYPIGFNTFYCAALKQTSAAVSDEKIDGRVSCEEAVQPETVIGSGCDRFIKQCYATCQDAMGRTHKCSFDSYMQRFVEGHLKSYFELQP